MALFNIFYVLSPLQWEALMAKFDDITSALGNVSSELDRIGGLIQSGGLSASEADEVLAQAQALVAKAQAITGPSQP